jgi:YesN/AraC family two-component response regulator
MDTDKQKKILIADDEEEIAGLLAEVVRKAGYVPLCAGNGVEALKLYKLMHPDLVITDIKMPLMDGIHLLKVLKQVDRNVLLILISSYGNEEYLLEALRAGAINYFKKPFKIEEIRDTVHAILEHKSQVDTYNLPFHNVLEEKKEYTVETEKTNLGSLINQISVNFKNFFSERVVINLRLGIEEMISNAIEHGNLAIGFDAKAGALKAGSYGSLLQEKLNNPKNSRKKIYVSSHLSNKGVSVTVRDQGNGFDWKTLPSLNANDIQHYNGRGILLTRIFFDEVIYHDPGNRVTLIKRI